MPVLVDGNNLLFAARKVEPETPLIGRSLLCGKLGEWARRKAERVHVVFDGPEPERGLAWQIANAGIRVSFSGAGVSADERLIELIELDSAARRLVLISSDHAIRQVAKRRRARVVRAEEFWQRVQRVLSKPPAPRGPREPREKRAGLTPEETARWMREFGFDE